MGSRVRVSSAPLKQKRNSLQGVPLLFHICIHAGGINLKSVDLRVSNFRHCVGCQKWSEDSGKRRYCLSVASCVSAEIRVTVIFGNARHTAGDFSFVSFLLVMQKKRKTIESLEHLEHLETKQHDRSPPDHNINHHRRTKQRRNSGDRQRIGKQIGDDVAHQKQVGTNQCCGG